MLIRFTLLAPDRDSGRKQGILTAAHELRNGDLLSVDEHRQLRQALEWFNDKIPIPKALKEPSAKRAISWFKPEADDAIARMWDLKSILDQHGLHIVVHKTKDPGTVIYEDSLQVVAVPAKGSKLS